MYEICCKANLSLQQAKDIFRSYPMRNGLPEGIEIEELIQFVYIEYEDIGRGRASISSETSVEKKADMASKLLNCLGYFQQNLKSYYH